MVMTPNSIVSHFYPIDCSNDNIGFQMNSYEDSIAAF